MRCVSLCAYLVVALAAALAALGYVGRQAPFSRGMLPMLLRDVHFTHADIPNLRGKTIIVTGANVGLGKSTAKYLALNGAKVIMACRSLNKCEQAKREIAEELKKEPEAKDRMKFFSESNLVPMKLDLGSLKEILSFAEKFKKENKQLDSLILNAGVMHPPFTLTDDGFESQIGTNHIGHFYLTKQLMPMLEKSQPSTIVVVSSNGHFMPYPEGVRLTLKDLNNESSYDPILAYGQSKLANVLFAQELAAKYLKSKDRVYVNSLNPGGVNTELTRHYPEWAQKMVKSILETFPNKLFFEPDWAALTQIYLAVSPEVIEKKITGKYYVPIADECDTSAHAKNETMQKELWKLTEKLLKDKGHV